MDERTCIVLERGRICGKPAVGRDLCRKHYTRWWRHGDPLATGSIRGDDLGRFWSKVGRRDDGECWPWLDSPDPHTGGYGRLRLAGKVRLAHAVAWEIAHGVPVPPGHHVDHVCHNEAVAAGLCVHGVCAHRMCVNPAHLVTKLPIEHTADTISAGGLHWNNRLSPDLVAEIKAMLASGMTGPVVAGRVGVSQSTVGRVRRGEDTFSVGRSA